MTFLVAFLLFSAAVAAMGVGVMLTGRKLHGSCGGMAVKNGSDLGDCVCARKTADLCGDGADKELVAMAEAGWPMKRPTHSHEPRAEPPAADRLDV